MTSLDGEYTPPPEPGSQGPAAEILGEIDLSYLEGDHVYALHAAGTAERAHIAVVDRSTTAKAWLVTIGPGDDGLVVTDTVEMPPFSTQDGIDTMHVLDDGTVLVAGMFEFPQDVSQGADYGFVVVEPGSGEVREAVVLAAEGSSSGVGDSALSTDGRTLFAYRHEDGAPGTDHRLVAVDVATGTLVAEHDVRADPATAGYGWLDFRGIAPGADGGVRVLVRAGEQPGVEGMTAPLVLSYGPDLQPVGAPVQLTEPGDVRPAVVPGATDGTLFAVVDEGSGGQVFAVPPGAGEGIPLVRGTPIDWLARQAVDPGQQWLTIPLMRGAASIDLTAAESAEPVDTGCREGQGVRWTVPGSDGTTFLLGSCSIAETSHETVWVVGP